VSDECNTNQTDYVKVLSNVRSEGLTVVSRIQCSGIGHCILLHWDQTWRGNSCANLKSRNEVEPWWWTEQVPLKFRYRSVSAMYC